MPQSVIEPFGIRRQTVVTALLNHGAVGKDGDLIAKTAGGEAMADIDGRLIPLRFH